MEIAWQLLVLSFFWTLLLQLTRTFYLTLITKKTYEVLDRFFDISHFKRFSVLAQELIELRGQLKATSAMDEFARWAKLNRACTKKENEFEDLHKRRQLDLVKFQVTYKIGFFVLAAALELAFFLYHSKEALITDISLFFPLNYIVSLPLGCSNCISFWTVYVCVFFIVLTGLQRITRRLPKKYSKKKNDQLNFNTEVPVDVDELESADELVELLPTVPSSTPENKLD